MSILLEMSEYIKAKTVVDLYSLKKRFENRSVPSFRRDLSKLRCITSYTNNSSYYTLPDIPEYDEYGIWKHGDVRFSRHGTAKETALILINDSARGLSHAELQQILGVRLFSPLKALVREKAIVSEHIGNKMMYFSGKEATRQRQQSSLADFVATMGNPFNLATVIDVLLAVFIENKTEVDDAYRYLKAGKHPHATRKEIEDIFIHYQLPGKYN